MAKTKDAISKTVVFCPWYFFFVFGSPEDARLLVTRTRLLVTRTRLLVTRTRLLVTRTHRKVFVLLLKSQRFRKFSSKSFLLNKINTG